MRFIPKQSVWIVNRLRPIPVTRIYQYHRYRYFRPSPIAITLLTARQKWFHAIMH